MEIVDDLEYVEILAGDAGVIAFEALDEAQRDDLIRALESAWGTAMDEVRRQYRRYVDWVEEEEVDTP